MIDPKFGLRAIIAQSGAAVNKTPSLKNRERVSTAISV
jgi:hypothetical protein